MVQIPYSQREWEIQDDFFDTLDSIIPESEVFTKIILDELLKIFTGFSGFIYFARYE